MGSRQYGSRAEGVVPYERKKRAGGAEGPEPESAASPPFRVSRVKRKERSPQLL